MNGTPEGTKIIKTSKNSRFSRKNLQNTGFLIVGYWRGVRDLNPRGPKDHRLSRPRLPNGTAPYQARATPPPIPNIL